MSGEFGLAGYRFQYHVIVLTALELWCGSDDFGVDSIVIEGRPGAEKVDYELIGRVGTDGTAVQVKSRWGAKAWSPNELLGLLTSLERDATESTRLELVANGAFSSKAQQFVEMLDQMHTMTDADLAQTLRRLTSRKNPSTALLEALRRSSVRVQPCALPELRDRVRVELRRVRAMSGQALGDQPAELLRAHLLGLAMDKSEADDVAGRTWRREEFLAAVRASRTDVETALAARWGVPVGLLDRQHAVRREALLKEVATHLTTADGTHTTDGRVRTCVLTGPAGIGKTTLAQQYALDNAAEFDWIYQLTADADDDSAASEGVLAGELEQFAAWLHDKGIAIRDVPHRSPQGAAAAVVEALATCTRSWLLIIDNAPAADTIASLLPTSGYGAVLITTRSNAWHGQHPVVSVGALTTEQGRVLVQRRLVDWALADSDADALSGRLDGLPLSLVTATSYLRSTRESIGDFLDSLNDEVKRLDALSFPLQRLDDYPRTAVAAVNLALQRIRARGGDIPADAINVLRRLSVLHPDQIPVQLLTIDRSTLNVSVAALTELSLIDRWQDSEKRDWMRVHRVVQDVVRAELGTHPDEFRTTLLAMEKAVTELMFDCTNNIDMVIGGALRLHATTLAERLKQRGEQSWQTTTAMLSNTASIARLQGSLTEAERLLREALDLIPPNDYDPIIAGRRGMTLANLANLQLEHNDSEAARSTLEAARRAHDLHRLIPAHSAALVACTALLNRLEAYRTTDKAEIRARFENVKALPEPTHEAAMERAASLVVIARQLDWNAGEQNDFLDSAERLLILSRQQGRGEAVADAYAHLALAEAHGAEGATDAFWRHYQRFKEIVSGMPGLDPAFQVDESVELAFGLTGLCIDKTTGYPYRDIDKLIRMLLDDIDDQVAEADWTTTERDWMSIRISSVKAVHAAQNGHLDEYKRLAREVKTLRRQYRKKLPSNVEMLADNMELVESLAELQRTLRHGLAPGQGLSDSLSAPVRPRYEPRPCHHFDPLPPRQVPAETDEPGVELSGAESGLSIDRVRGIAVHSALLASLSGDGLVSAADVENALRAPVLEPQDYVDHLIGAWRLLDTVSYTVGEITGESIDDVRTRCDDGLIRSQHDDLVDTVPTRAVLRCLHQGWYPELNDILTHMTHEAMVRLLADLVGVELDLADELAGLTGTSLSETIARTRDLAIAFDSPSFHPGTCSYDAETGTISVGRTITGDRVPIWLNDPETGTVDHVWLLGDDGMGKSNALRIVLMEAIGSGLFHIFPSDPRNEHGFDRLWDKVVHSPAWIAMNVADTLRNLEAAVRVIEGRAASPSTPSPTPERVGILFGIDDADDVLRLPRGRELIDFVVTNGPTVGVGMVMVIRDLGCVEGDEVLCRALANARSAQFLGSELSDRWNELKSTYRSRS
ncbi:tetratricopeptide repeat protein [Lentzea sp. HUAS12]|uniref:tetratricopeptide repeat protein n=1 Tax=Lentzea sp. HUAS12 TaxID=2951806 RepID=UPI0020A006CB|nr:tetratricopeptide repeat protein [Lentzea sp. HUAS12]USX56332.1 tetratricopeptide repeat protein [Lentzea sp. HUAS12]